MSSLYRTALQVSSKRIAALSESELGELMRDLLNARAYLCGANVAKVVVNEEDHARDDGADGSSPAPARPDPWLGDVETIWQFKAGSAGEPSRLKKEHEVRKPRPRATLESGGRFVVVASGSTRGDTGERVRRAALVQDAAEAGIPTDRIVVYGSESLANWCNEHPAIAARLASRPLGLWSLSDWARDEHAGEWQPIESQVQAIAELRAALDLDIGQTLHVHIFGHPGVGKSRFALELCREAAWHAYVLYVRQPADLSLQELLSSCVDDAGVRLILVVDEVEHEQLLPLRASVSRANGRIRLVTIGSSSSPDLARIQGYEVNPVPEHTVMEVVRKWHPGMPREHVEFVARFSDGYMRLAWLAANTVRRNPSIDARVLLEQTDVQNFLNKMLGNLERRRSLHVVAVLTSVGWTEEREGEGKAVATHLGLDWGEVRQEVEIFDRRFHIAPRSGRLRNISPTPLALYLALEAWANYATELRDLPTVLSGRAIDAYYERLETLAGSPQANAFAREELERLFQKLDLTDARAIRRWSALALSDPAVSACQMRAELARLTRQERLAISGPARSFLVYKRIFSRSGDGQLLS